MHRLFADAIAFSLSQSPSRTNLLLTSPKKYFHRMKTRQTAIIATALVCILFITRETNAKATGPGSGLQAQGFLVQPRRLRKAFKRIRALRKIRLSKLDRQFCATGVCATYGPVKRCCNGGPCIRGSHPSAGVPKIFGYCGRASHSPSPTCSGYSCGRSRLPCCGGKICQRVSIGSSTGICRSCVTTNRVCNVSAPRCCSGLRCQASGSSGYGYCRSTCSRDHCSSHVRCCPGSTCQCSDRHWIFWCRRRTCVSLKHFIRAPEKLSLSPA